MSYLPQLPNTFDRDQSTLTINARCGIHKVGWERHGAVFEERDIFHDSRSLTARGKQAEWYEISLYAFLAFLIFEGLFRRAFPALGTIILAAKFGIMPCLIAWHQRKFPGSIALRRLPPWLLLFLGYGAILTTIFIGNESLARFVGGLVNILFVPLFLVGVDYFSRFDRIQRLIQWLAILSGLVGLIGIYQSRLPPTHWMVAMTNEDRAIQLTSDLARVPGTFQFPNTYGIFAPMSLTFCLTAILWSNQRVRQVLFLGALIASCVGVVFTGSRAAGFGMIAILFLIVFAAFTSSKATVARKRLFAIGAALLFGASLSMLLFEDGGPILSGAQEAARNRTFVGLTDRGNVDTLDGRVNYYLGTRLINALEVGNGIGVGWGLYTQGTNRFLKQQLNVEVAEGGYARILVESGVFGLVFFFFIIIDAFLIAWSDRSSCRQLGFALAGILALTHLSLYMLQITVVAAPFWLVLGAYRGIVQKQRQVPRIIVD